MDTDWSQYETFVFSSLQRLYPGGVVRRNVHLTGTKTGQLRQIDVLVETSVADIDLKIAVDCKCYKKKLNVNDVERFLGMLDDVRVSKGVIVTNNGYTDGAYRRAHHEARDVELRILKPEYLSEFHNIGGAVAWYGPVAAVISAPHTWVIDNQPTTSPFFTLFSMYPLGHTRESAIAHGAFLYGNVTLKSQEYPAMEAIAAYHERVTLARFPGAKFQRLPSVEREREKTLFRVGDIHKGYKGYEYSLYIDHPNGVLLLVLLCPQGEEETYLPELEWVGQKCILLDRVEGPADAADPRLSSQDLSI